MDRFFSFNIGEIEYKAEKMNAKKQFHVARRLAPLISEIMAVLKDYHKTPENNIEDEKESFLSAKNQELLTRFSDTLNRLKDDDLDYIINTCCQNVKRKDKSSGIYQSIMTNEMFCFEDIEFYEMLQIVIFVIKGNLSNFFQKHLSNIEK